LEIEDFSVVVNHATPNGMVETARSTWGIVPD
jgi:hypothetical protein